MATPELPEDTPAWYFNKGIPLGIIIYLIVLTIGGTAYITNLADRITHVESLNLSKFAEDNQARHAELMTRLTIIELRIADLMKQSEGKK